jgi:hypothetical protein
MHEALRERWMMAEQDQQISKAIELSNPAVNFIRKRVPDPRTRKTFCRVFTNS